MRYPNGTDSRLHTPSLSLVQEGIESALSLVGVGVWEYLVPENIFSCSDGIYQLVGVDPAVGRQAENFWPGRVHPDDQIGRTSAYADFLRGVAPTYEENYRIRHETGSWIAVMSRARWVSRTDGKPGRCVLGYAIDVTARNEDFDRLRAREERFRMSVSALHGVVYDYDIRANKAERYGVKGMLGYETLEGEDGFDGWMSIVHPAERVRVMDRVVEARANAGPFEMNYRVLHQNGGWRHLRQRGTYTVGFDGKPIRAYGVIEDITEATEQREVLQVQAAIIERMTEGVLLIDRTGNILFANPALEKLFGYGSGELSGKHSQLLSSRGAEYVTDLVRAIFDGTENDKSSVIDLEGRHRDGSLRSVQGCFSSIEIGTQRCVLAVLTDIAELRQLERELMQVVTRVQQRIGSDLHDGLGQQLAGIAMMLHGLARRAGAAGVPALNQDVDEIVELVNAAIRNTRSLARGLAPVRSSREGLMEGFEELVNQVHERYHIRVSMELDLPQDLQLDENAATNLYYIAQEGVLNAARYADAENIAVQLRIAGSGVELLVTDDGKGFDPLQITRGGMGLRIMRFRAQLLAGFLSVESRPGAGTTVRCRCPVKITREVA